jgi:integrase/recombinase XerD
MQADTSDPLGIRDRAILETLYSTGMRRMELVNLALYDLDLDRGTLMVRQGKGKKDRMVPIGERAAVWIEKYRSDVRHQLVVEPDDGTLFLTAEGARFSLNGMTSLARNYVLAADTGKRGACHLFRHTMATQMLENGADIRFIQQMLGHAKLETTQIYTQVSIRKLQEIHRATHPTARHERTSVKKIAAAKETNAHELIEALEAEANEEE